MKTSPSAHFAHAAPEITASITHARRRTSDNQHRGKLLTAYRTCVDRQTNTQTSVNAEPNSRSVAVDRRK